jgi:glycosyltransferase involved in cell wall biosynthesis
MKIAYATRDDVSNRHAWSGLAYHIRRALVESGMDVYTIEAGVEPGNIQTMVKGFVYRTLFSRNYLEERELSFAKRCSESIRKELERVECDIVFSPGTIPTAYLQTVKPIVFWTDATFAAMINFYPVFSNLCSESIRHGNALEQAALSQCALAIFSSDWAAKTATENYDIDPSKIRVVPFGANIDCDRRIEDIVQATSKKTFDVLKLLFVGVEWFRKGGDIALEVAALLNSRGIPTELHIVGCNPPGMVPDFVKVHGFLPKTTPQERKKLNAIYADSHFLILPARAECFGVVFAEANSFGLPCLAAEVGGIPTAVRDGVNGRLFPAGSPPIEYAQYLERLASSKAEYEALALSSFREFSDRLNWSSAGRQVREYIQELRWLH